MTSQPRVLGVIGGSGVYKMDALQGAERIDVETAWGAPSSPLVRGDIGGVKTVFLARHGEGHRLSPGDINYRANIAALKGAGVTDVISLSACGSFREDLPPGTFVIADQFIDRTTQREKSFFGKGFVAHVSMAQPVCPALGRGARRLASHIIAAGSTSLSTGRNFLRLPSPLFIAHGAAT